ncbi:MAG: DUF433 domain-containing protein [Bacteroidia bacterium]|jgi:uncharacterized protein (DUF433 family)
MNYRERIVSDHKIMLGKPIIKGTRITVELILNKLSAGESVKDILTSYPHLKKEDVMAAIDYAAAVISNEEMIGGK